MKAHTKLALFLFAVALGVLITLLASNATRTQAPSQSPSDSAPPHAFGWIDDPDAVRESIAVMNAVRFRDTPAFAIIAARDATTDDVFLWEACRTATGNVLPARDQKSVGCCVGFAAATAIEHLLCVQIVNGSREDYRDLAAEVIYGGSRVEIGGGRVRGDGSVGVWAARFVKEYGIVPRTLIGRSDLRHYDERRCREFGRLGLPADVKDVAKAHPVRDVAQVKTWEECRAAIQSGHPVMVCSSQGFTRERDADGFGLPKGTWYHAMAAVGIRGDPRPGAFLPNSWGETFHSGPRYPDDAPPCGFWVDAAVLDRMLHKGDSWAFSNAAGFAALK